MIQNITIFMSLNIKRLIPGCPIQNSATLEVKEDSKPGLKIANFSRYFCLKDFFRTP